MRAALVLITMLLVGLATFGAYRRWVVSARVRAAASLDDVPRMPESQCRLRGVSPCGPQGCPFRLSVGSRGACYEGDLDYLRRDLSIASEAKLLLTIEKIAGEGEMDPMTRSVSVAEIEKGLTREIVLPPATEPRVLGVFLCRTTGASTCKDKEGLPSVQMMNEHVTGKITDKLYYFQTLVQHPDGLFAGSEDAEVEMDDGTWRCRARAMKADAMSEAGRALMSSALDACMRLRRTTSLPFVLADGYLGMELPGYRKESCAGRAAIETR